MMLLQLLLGDRKISWHLASSEVVDAAVEKVYREIHKQNALMDLYYRSPDESAHQVLFKGQKYFFIGVIIAVIVAVAISAAVTFAVLFALVNVIYFLINPLKSTYPSEDSSGQTKSPPSRMNSSPLQKQKTCPSTLCLFLFIMKQRSFRR